MMLREQMESLRKSHDGRAIESKPSLEMEAESLNSEMGSTVENGQIKSNSKNERLEKIKRYRDLLYMITWRDIKVKYKQSIMGFLWAFLMPMLVILAGILVRFGMARLSGRQVVLSEIVTVAVKSLPWSFFVASVRFATNSLVASSSLVTKIFFPREILPLSAVLSQFVDFVVASSLLVIVCIFAHIAPSPFLLWVPFLIAILVIITVALGLLLAAANLFFRDVKYIVETILTFAIFFTPVLYDAKMAGRLEWVLLLNPLAPILEGLNCAIVLGTSPNLAWILYSTMFALCILPVALKAFKSLEPRFAESI
jgi:lipopolysaccharide transport system permease protein